MKLPTSRPIRTGPMGFLTATFMLLPVVAPLAVAGQSADDVSVVVQVEAPNHEPMEMTYWLGPERLRMDTEPASMVWVGGASPPSGRHWDG